MALCFDRDNGNLRCCVWRVTETLDELGRLVPHGAALLAEASERYMSAKRRMEYVAVHVLLATVLHGEVRVGHHATGRPYLVGSPHLHVSVSHTAGYVAVALSGRGIPGVDIERYSTRIDKLRKRIVSSEETATNTWDILLHWCAKETAFKMMDCEGVDFLSHLHVNGLPGGADTLSDIAPFRLRSTHPSCEKVYTVEALLFEDAVLTYAVD